MSIARDISDAGHQLVAWIKFDGSASIPSSGTSTVGILASFNISSLNEISTGRYEITMTNSVADHHMCVVASASAGTGNTDAATFVHDSSNQKFTVYTYTSDSGNLSGSYTQISAVAYR
tara:strand:- start:370 stop:726 length:357 start_codon:yes stop_codon:yes gene_type:complete